MEKITTNMPLNSDNWSHGSLINGDLRAIVSFGGGLDNDGNVSILYFLTVLDANNEEIYQEEHTELDSAIKAANLKYGRWEYAQRGENGSSDGGCGDCAAH